MDEYKLARSVGLVSLGVGLALLVARHGSPRVSAWVSGLLSAASSAYAT